MFALQTLHFSTENLLQNVALLLESVETLHAYPVWRSWAFRILRTVVTVQFCQHVLGSQMASPGAKYEKMQQ